jgi:hypothetical protein
MSLLETTDHSTPFPPLPSLLQWSGNYNYLRIQKKIREGEREGSKAKKSYQLYVKTFIRTQYVDSDLQSQLPRMQRWGGLHFENRLGKKLARSHLHNQTRALLLHLPHYKAIVHIAASIMFLKSQIMLLFFSMVLRIKLGPHTCHMSHTLHVLLLPLC